jgi:hypothetical protein
MPSRAKRQTRKNRQNRTPLVTDATLLGQKGMNMAERLVLEMGFLWNAIHLEAGIDAIIEIRDPSTGEAKNKIVQVQVKAVTDFSAERDDAFSFSCDRPHIRYWLGGTARVILVVCKPNTDEIYWKDLRSYFSLPENRDRCTVHFSKKEDRFDPSCRSKLMQAAQPEGGLALGAVPKHEILGINLLPLGGYPSEIFATPTKATAWDDFFAAIKELKKPWLREFIWEGGTLYSFFDPESEGIADLYEQQPTPFPTVKWAESLDPVLQRHFADLLGRAFEHRCYKRGVVIDREKGVFYFAVPEDGSELRITTKSLVNTTGKTVVSKHPSIRHDGTPSMYYKHYAFIGRTRRFSNQWFFELTPTYYFTEDGRTPHLNAEALLKGIKRMERHPAVLSAFLTWKEYLTEETLLTARYRYLTVTPPTALPIDRGIDDVAWRTLAPIDQEPESSILDTAELISPFGEDEDGLFLWKPN